MADLETSKAQLAMIESALLADPSNEDLLQLKNDLQLLIQLTQEEASVSEATQSVSSGTDERSKGDSVQDSMEEQDDQSTTTSLSEDLSNLEGMKVMAPFTTNYSGQSFHHAVIFGVESQSISSFEDIEVSVVFSHPTETGMVACKHFLQGKCNRDAESCRWSHGEVVRLADLKAWQEPDWTSITKGTIVLTRQDDGVWLRARVEGREHEAVIVQFEGQNSEPFVTSIEDVWPLDQSDAGSGDSSDEENLPSTSMSVVHESDDVDTFCPVDLATFCSDSVSGGLGEWESHTRGVGSRLMSNMGWTGGGLGKQGEGRVEPVPAMVYPPGMSLDWCMERREKAGGGDMLSVEKTLKRQAKIEERKSRQRAKREEARDNSAKSLFDFINVKLGGIKKGDIGQLCHQQRGSKNNGKGAKNSGTSRSSNLKEESNDRLRIEAFKLSEKVRVVEKEISRLKESYTRHQPKDPRTAAGIKVKLEEKERELAKLRQNERKVHSEQGTRKDKSKLQIF